MSHDVEESEAEYEVEYLRASRVVSGERQYLIHWKGYDRDSETWEPESSLSNCVDLIRAFWKQQPDGPIAPVRKIHIIGTKCLHGDILYSVELSSDKIILATHAYLGKHYPFELLDYIINH